MEPWLALDLASESEARAMLQSCCGSTLWVERMLARRPFARREQMLRAAREEWFALSPSDWREALRRCAGTRSLSEREQAGADAASDEVVARLAKGNTAYEARFGYIFIICATGRSADEMLALLESRLNNEPASEMQIAAEEQAKITELRLLGL